MKARRKVAPPESTDILEIGASTSRQKPEEELSDIPASVLAQLKEASDPNPVRFSKTQLNEKYGLSITGGGLVCIDGKVYAFVESKEDSNKSYIIGEGGFGKVKLLQNVEDPYDQKALKVIGTHKKGIKTTAVSEVERKNFEKELKVAEALGRGSRFAIKKVGDSKVRNIEKIYNEKGEWIDSKDIEKSHESYCGVLDLARGQSLEKFIGDQKLDGAARLNIASQCFQEIKLMHQHGFMHNDVKPHNFMFDPDAKDGKGIKIIDFGAVVEFDPNNPSFENTYHTQGTTFYTAPEIKDSSAEKKVVTPKNDVYALGRTLQELYGLLPERMVYYEQQSLAMHQFIAGHFKNVEAFVEYGKQTPGFNSFSQDQLEATYALAVDVVKNYHAYQIFLKLPPETQEALKSLANDMTQINPDDRCGLNTAINELSKIMNPNLMEQPRVMESSVASTSNDAKKTSIPVSDELVENKGAVVPHSSVASALEAPIIEIFEQPILKGGSNSSSMNIISKLDSGPSTHCEHKNKQEDVKIVIQDYKIYKLQELGLVKHRQRQGKYELVFSNAEQADQIFKALKLGNVQVEQGQQGKSLIFSLSEFKRFNDISNEQTTSLIQLSNKYHALGNSETHQAKKRVLAAAVRYLLAEHREVSEFTKVRDDKNNKKWCKGRIQHKVRDLIGLFEKEAGIQEPKNDEGGFKKFIKKLGF